MKTIFVSLIAVLISFSSLVNAQQFNLEVKSEYEIWDTGLGGGLAKGILGGAGLGYYKDSYFAGGGFLLGNYNLEKDSDKEVQRIDFDAVIGKKLDSQWSVYTGYRYNRLNRTSKTTPSLDRRENTAGAGLGISFSLPFTPKWIAFMSGVATGLYSYNNFDSKGTGYSVGTEGGILYSVNAKTSISVRGKYQTTKISYDGAEDWVHAYNRVGANIGYLF